MQSNLPELLFRSSDLLCLLVFLCLWCKGQTLTESESVVIKPGNNHKLTCTFSGIDVGDWISHISAPRDNSKIQVYLHMTNLQAEDTAIYYCARKKTKQ
uniref:Immunoglobulin V-set domain-containing protein n=1 Tax=Cyprinus carpio TaxID=7962 RepID=A0A8C2FCZ8_CYPCA